MKTSSHTLEFRANHHKALFWLAKTVNPSNLQDGLSIWRKLCRIERDFNAAATAQCNGGSYMGQPFRQENAWEAYKANTRAKVTKVFGGSLPAGFTLNSDPRGYSLKIDPDKAPIPAGMHRDFGGYGILAAQID